MTNTNSTTGVGGAPHVGFTCGACDFDLFVLIVCQFANSFGIRTSKNTQVNSLE
jgi:hypothetical protein